MNKYQGVVKINPKEKFLAVELELDYIVSGKIDKIELFLYQNLEIKEISCENMKGFIHEEENASWSPFIHESRRIIIMLEEPVDKGKSIKIKFKYLGVIDTVSKWQVNRISEELVELGMYAPWYPLLKNLDDAIFDLNIQLPQGYTVVNADYRFGYHHLIQDTPNYDCTIIASKEFKEIENINKSNVKVLFSLDEYKEVASRIYVTSNEIFRYFEKTIGPLNHDNQISICMVNRNVGGGYCRPGLVVIMHGQKDSRFLGHEISHLWWNKATNYQHDWLNESFAEYSSLMMLRVSSQDVFDDYIKKYKEETKDTAPIPTVKRDDEESYKVLYHKGPVLLNQLEQKIGKDLFIQLLQEMHKEKIAETRDFFTLLGKITSIKVMEWFKNKFDNE